MAKSTTGVEPAEAPLAFSRKNLSLEEEKERKFLNIVSLEEQKVRMALPSKLTILTNLFNIGPG